MELGRYKMGNGIEKKVFQLMVQVDGFELKVIAQQLRDQEWQLAVQNELGVNSVWLETFSDVDQAIDAGIMAIENEGAYAFCGVEGFEYLLN